MGGLSITEQEQKKWIAQTDKLSDQLSDLPEVLDKLTPLLDQELASILMELGSLQDELQQKLKPLLSLKGSHPVLGDIQEACKVSLATASDALKFCKLYFTTIRNLKSQPNNKYLASFETFTNPMEEIQFKLGSLDKTSREIAEIKTEILINLLAIQEETHVVPTKKEIATSYHEKNIKQLEKKLHALIHSLSVFQKEIPREVYELNPKQYEDDLLPTVDYHTQASQVVVADSYLRFTTADMYLKEWKHRIEKGFKRIKNSSKEGLQASLLIENELRCQAFVGISWEIQQQAENANESFSHQDQLYYWVMKLYLKAFASLMPICEKLVFLKTYNEMGDRHIPYLECYRSKSLNQFHTQDFQQRLIDSLELKLNGFGKGFASASRLAEGFPRFEKKCDYLQSQTRPTAEDLYKLPISSPQAYVRVNHNYRNSVFFVDRDTNECWEINLSEENLKNFDALLKASPKARTLSKAELQQISNILCYSPHQSAFPAREQFTVDSRSFTLACYLKEFNQQFDLLLAEFLPNLKMVDQCMQSYFQDQKYEPKNAFEQEVITFAKKVDKELTQRNRKLNSQGMEIKPAPVKAMSVPPCKEESKKIISFLTAPGTKKQKLSEGAQLLTAFSLFTKALCSFEDSTPTQTHTKRPLQ